MVNPKSQIPNPKQIPMTEISMSKTKIRLEFRHCNFGFVCNLVLVIWCLIVLLQGILMSGCATIIEGAKGIVGISTKALEDGRKDAIKKTFNYDYNTCYKRTKNILANAGTYTYAQDAKKRMLAVYVSEQDTTPVGVFFKEIDANNTQIEVSSPSTFAKEFIAAKIFAILEKPLDDKM